MHCCCRDQCHLRPANSFELDQSAQRDGQGHGHASIHHRGFADFRAGFAGFGGHKWCPEAISTIQFDVVTAMLLMMLVLLFLGCFMDQISMILLTLPFFLPISETLGIHPTWLMVMMLIAMEISLLTPPFGLLLFVMRGVAPKNIGLGQIYAAAVPFVLIELAVMIALAIFPTAALWLPSLLR